MVFVGFVMCGCGTAKVESAEWLDAEFVDERMVVGYLDMELGERRIEPVTMREDYGVMVVWNEYEGRRFYLFDRPAKRYFGTDQFDPFLKELSAWGRNRDALEIDTCQMSRANRMPQVHRDALDRASEGIVGLGEDYDFRQVICTCEGRLDFLPIDIPLEPWPALEPLPEVVD